MSSDRIGKYQVVAEIGRGGMGTVFKAFDPDLGRHLAVKTLSFSMDGKALERFRREARAAAQLNHPNIVTVYAFGEEQNRPYIAMELLEGADLRDALQQHMLQTLVQKLEIVQQVCGALTYAHERGVVHRDLKPGNIFISSAGLAKVLDFGLARQGASDVSSEGIVVGTPNYMSPEQVQGGKIDARSDLFSLGAVLYELLTNRKPFEADSLPGVLFNVVQRNPDPARRWGIEVPESLDLLLQRALAKDPALRFQSAVEMLEALRKARAEEPTDADSTIDLSLSRGSAAALPQAALSTGDLLALMDTGRELAGELSLRALLQRILERATELTDSPDSSVILHDDKQDFLYFAHATGPAAPVVLERWGRRSGQGIPIEGSKAGEVFATGKSLIVNSMPDEPSHFKAVDADTRQATASMVCVPMTVMGRRIGVVQLLNKRTGDYTSRDLLLLEHFASQAAVAIRNARVFNDLMAHMGFYAGNESQGPVELLSEVARPAWKEVLSVLFAGMRGFTQLCHIVGEPQRVQSILNECLGGLAESVIRHEGIVNKFHGDGVIALFRNSQHEIRAVQCAAEIVERFHALRKRWDDEINAQLDFLDVGVGVATDTVILGSMGSDVVRSFSAVGTAMNLASHLMEEARDGRRILIDKRTYAKAKEVVVECEGPEPFVLKKPGQEIGHPFKRYCVSRVQGIGVQQPGERRTSDRRESSGGATREALAKGEIFVSYCHEDRVWLEQLQKHLKPYLQSGAMRAWDDTKIQAGQEWRAAVKDALATAKVAVLLVSPNFLNSDFIGTNELPPLLQAGKDRGLHILWVPLSASSYDETDIGGYQAALNPARPLDQMAPAEQNQALVELCKKIKAAATA